MITIQSGKMMIPEEERFVGFAGDDRSNSKQFILPQTLITDAGAVFSLYLRFDDDRVTSAPLTVQTVDSDTILTWNLRAEHLLRPGIVMAQIKYTAADGSVTHYSWDYFIVGASAEFADDGNERDFLSRTEFERRMAQAVRDARATAPYIGDDGYWYIYSREQGDYARSFSASGIAVDNAMSASSTNPVENRAVKAYVDAADSTKADKTTHVAGLPLSGNISADDLYGNMAGKINPPLVTIGVTPGYPAQYGKTADNDPVYCSGLNTWVPLAKAADIPAKTSDLTNDSGFLTQHQNISGKMDVAPITSYSDDDQLTQGQMYINSGEVWLKHTARGATGHKTLAEKEDLAAKMDRVQRITNPANIPNLARDQLFEVQGAIGITAHYTGSDWTQLAKQDSLDLTNKAVESIQSYLGYYGSMSNDVVGLQVDFVNTRFTRLAGAVEKSAGLGFNQFYMYGGRRRCNVADDGTINAYYGDAGYTEDGSNGQVMVYQPAFWYRVVPLKLEKNTAGLGYHIRKANYYISATPKTGFKLHPLFRDANGNPVDYVLLSAYEGSMYDVSASAYVDDSSDGDAGVTYGIGDLLCSVTNKKPISGKLSGIGTRANLETMAANRGAGWHLETCKSLAANQLLMMIELGTPNTQTAIGKGCVQCSDTENTNCSCITGSTGSLGNTTGAAVSTTQRIGNTITINTENGKVAVSYRGQENPWGNISKHINGVNVWGDGSMGGGQLYVCKNFSYTEQSHSGNYAATGISLPNGSGYISAFGYGSEEFDWMLMPSERAGSSALPIGDYAYCTNNLNGYRGVRNGGDWNDVSYTGAFFEKCGDQTGYAKADTGGRLLYVPTAVI